MDRQACARNLPATASVVSSGIGERSGVLSSLRVVFDPARLVACRLGTRALCCLLRRRLFDRIGSHAPRRGPTRFADAGALRFTSCVSPRSPAFPWCSDRLRAPVRVRGRIRCFAHQAVGVWLRFRWECVRGSWPTLSACVVARVREDSKLGCCKEFCGAGLASRKRWDPGRWGGPGPGLSPRRGVPGARRGACVVWRVSVTRSS